MWKFLRPLTLSDAFDLEINTMQKLGCSKEEILRIMVRRYNWLQDQKWFGKKHLDEEELVTQLKQKDSKHG